MAEPIKQKKKPVAKLNKILLEVTGESPANKDTVPIPIKSAEPIKPAPVKVPAPVKATAPVKGPAPVKALAPVKSPAPVKAPAQVPDQIKPAPAKSKGGTVPSTSVSISPVIQQNITNSLSLLNLDVPADSIVAPAQPLPNMEPARQAQPPPSMEPAQQEPPPAKKRGRKRKIALDKKYFDKDYITMWPEICMGQRILVDRYDNVYSYDLEAPRWLGVKTVYGKIDNTTETVPRTDYKYG